LHFIYSYTKKEEKGTKLIQSQTYEEKEIGGGGGGGMPKEVEGNRVADPDPDPQYF
jgi:hypothetical protein